MQLSSFFHAVLPGALVAVAGLASACCNIAGAVGVDLYLPEQVQINKTEVTLGDIVEIQGDDLPVVLRLRQVSLGQAPRVGMPVQLARADIARWVHARLGTLADPLVWHGALSATISVQSGKADMQKISSVAERALKEWLAIATSGQMRQSSVRMVVTEQTATREVALPGRDFSYIARPIADSATPQKNMDVWVEVHSAGHFVQVIPVRFSVAMFRQAWVARKSIASGDRLVADSYELKEADVMSVARPAEVRPASDQAVDDTRGIRAKRNLSAGDILTYGNTESYPVIVRGEMVTLRTAAGAVQLEGRGQALEDGSPGQLVHFMSTGASSRIVARIIGPGMAEIK